MPTDTDLEHALTTLGDLLQEQGDSFDLVVIGGGALLIIGLIDRPTEDLDVVARVENGRWLPSAPFPEPLRRAVQDVADALDLPANWLNAGPSGLRTQHGLPVGFEARAHVRQYASLTVRFAAREDQIALKLDAAADHWDRAGDSKHLEDLRTLQATGAELQVARKWCRTHRDAARLTDLDEVIAELLFGEGT